MAKLSRISVVTMLALVLATGTALAQNGNPCPGAKEYQFNIIGVPKAKNPDMTGNNGHRIFVNLQGNSKINITGDTDQNAANGLQCGDKFQVLDANATGGGGEATLLVPCDPLTVQNLDPDVCFEVFATTLGGPGNATVDVVCEFSADCLLCDTEADSCAMGGDDIILVRNSGKPVQQNITEHFRADGCIDLGGVAGVCDAGDIQFNNEWIFNIEQLLEYYWDYDNEGLRLTQVRFCDTEGVPGSDCGGGAIVP